MNRAVVCVLCIIFSCSACYRDKKVNQPQVVVAQVNEVQKPIVKDTAPPVTSIAVLRKAPPFEWVFVEGGSFNMGSTDGNFDEKPVHKVKLKSFFISKYEVTQAQWREVMHENLSHFQCDSCPVENVTWDRAFEFILKLNNKGNNYRFPTEAEWEYAARGGQKTHGYRYSGSNNLAEVGWYGSKSTHPVGTKKPNELGIYDMSGNVAEYCADWYDEAYYSNSPVENPLGPKEGGETPNRIVRGGTWGGLDWYCTVSRRFSLETNEALNGLGIRLVKDK